MSKSQNIRCIYTDDTTPRRYVSSTSNRPDKKIVLELTSNPDEAHDFATPDNAERIITSAHNPWERKFSHKMMKVTRSAQPIHDFNADLN